MKKTSFFLCLLLLLGAFSLLTSCAKCAHTELISSDMVEPTCTEDGYVKSICTECGESLVTVLPAKGHSFSVHICQHCGAVEQDDSSADDPEDPAPEEPDPEAPAPEEPAPEEPAPEEPEQDGMRVMYVDAAAPNGGNGTATAPYNDFAVALSAVKRLAAAATSPTKFVLRLADGVYSVRTVQVLRGNMFGCEGCSLTLEAENPGGATLTTTVPISAEDFVRYSENIYTYTFTLDANGKFPDFRYLYVDDALADIAAAGERLASSGKQTHTAYERTVDGPYLYARALYDLDLLHLAENPYPPERPALCAAYERYLADFLAWDTYLKEGSVGYAPVDPTSDAYLNQIGTRVISQGKIYLPATLFKGLEPLIESRLAAVSSSEEETACRTLLSDLGLMMHLSLEWTYYMIGIEGVDMRDSLIVLNAATGREECHYAVYLDQSVYASFSMSAAHKFSSRAVFLTGAPAFLDQHGEMYYDAAVGKLYVYLRDEAENHTFSYPTADTLLQLDGAENVTIFGLRFTGVDDTFLSENGHIGNTASLDPRFDDFPSRAAISIKNGCRALKIIACAIQEVPCDGISMRGRIDDLTLVENVISGTGASAIRIAADSDVLNTSHGLRGAVIQNNYLYDIAYIYRGSPALQIGPAADVTISGNTVRDCAYSAMLIGWRYTSATWGAASVGKDGYTHLNGVTIRGNYIYDFMTEMADGGAIHLLGGNASQSLASYLNTLDGNAIVFTKDSGNGSGGFLAGIYFEGSASHWHCKDNVIVAQSTWSGADIWGEPAYIQRRATTYIYLQHIAGQRVCNILCEGNTVVNVRAMANDRPYNGTVSAQQYEVYRTYLATERGVIQKDTRYHSLGTAIPETIKARLSRVVGVAADRPDVDAIVLDKY